MTDTKLRAPRATDVLKEDHERLKALFADYEEFADDSALTKQGIFEEILRALAVHVRIEEEIFYPAIAGRGPRGDGRDVVEEALEEHRIVKALLAEMFELAPDSPDFDATMQALEESVRRHADEEEKEIFPLFATLDAEKRDEVSEAQERRRAELNLGTAEGGSPGSA